NHHPAQIWRLRYSRNGALLYAAGDGGAVRRYRQYPGQQLKCLGELFWHRGDVVDMDISPFDECKLIVLLFYSRFNSFTDPLSLPYRSRDRFQGQNSRFDLSWLTQSRLDRVLRADISRWLPFKHYPCAPFPPVRD